MWTHNDSGGEAFLWAVGADGALRARIRVAGVTNVDWEDMERSDCPEGTCLYLAETGDNDEVRQNVGIYRLPEPAPRPDTVDAVYLPVRIPDGPRDVEALFVLPGERIHVITKGRSHPVTVYRYPPPPRPGERVTLEEVQTLTDGPPTLAAQVTGATATADGRMVAVRTYRSLSFYRVEDGRLERVPGAEVNLRSLQEAQGEGVAFGPDGRVILTSEAGPGGRRASLRELECPGVASAGG